MVSKQQYVQAVAHLDNLTTQLSHLGDIEDGRSIFGQARVFSVFLSRHPLGSNATYYLSLIKAIRNNPQWFIQNKNEIVQQVGQRDPELAKDIQTIQVPIHSLIPALSTLEESLLSLKGGQPWIAPRGYEQLKNTKLGEEVEHALSIHNGELQRYLERVIDVVSHWPTMRQNDPNRLDFFTKQLREFFMGIEGVQPGLHTHFKEKKIARALLSERHVRMLWSFKDFLNFVYYFEGRINASLSSKDWSDFLKEIMPKLDYFIRIARDRYGEKEFAALLQLNRKKFKEGIYQWDQSMKEQIVKFRDPGYQNAMIITPVSETIVRVFTQRIGELKKEEKSAIKKVIAAVKKEIEILEGKEAKSVVAFRMKVLGKMHALRTEHKEAIRIFESAEREYVRMLRVILHYIPIEDPPTSARVAKAGIKAVQWQQFISTELNSPRPRWGLIMLGLGKTDRAQDEISQAVDPFMETMERYIANQTYVASLVPAIYTHAKKLKDVMLRYPYLLQSQRRIPSEQKAA